LKIWARLQVGRILIEIVPSHRHVLTMQKVRVQVIESFVNLGVMTVIRRD
jgi:hypothetical protein